MAAAGPPPAKIPQLIYGTAWKKERTQSLVQEALIAGFRGIDTAAQPKHYREDLVGLGVKHAIGYNDIKREDLYIQTKFTSIQGQDPDKGIPYDPKSSIANQVNASITSSLKNFESPSAIYGQESYLDCLILHSPFPTQKQTEEAWRAMESKVPSSVRSLGISNIHHLSALKSLYDFATIKPSVVQNRFYRETGYDKSIRAFCKEKGITYQSFWTLTANKQRLLKSRCVELVAQMIGVTAPVALYALVLGLENVSVLDGTTSAQRMVEDLTGVAKVMDWARTHPNEWDEAQNEFNKALNL